MNFEKYKLRKPVIMLFGPLLLVIGCFGSFFLGMSVHSMPQMTILAKLSKTPAGIYLAILFTAIGVICMTLALFRWSLTIKD